eukprot:CAMPEP_0180082648 /NCGR_PEP_ID=MMETSP0985-20121206/18850_1 /TAXON_ID=483367 /ORGANISM="non described non described, Strain CCMP 2436" /LENGTH=157 /DNA_ID=CAMNT_0022016077 /DNA_START=157 /DNA_END=632 /DNA_ORIENTATION=+
MCHGLCRKVEDAPGEVAQSPQMKIDAAAECADVDTAVKKSAAARRDCHRASKRRDWRAGKCDCAPGPLPPCTGPTPTDRRNAARRMELPLKVGDKQQRIADALGLGARLCARARVERGRLEDANLGHDAPELVERQQRAARVVGRRLVGAGHVVPAG